MFSLLIREEYVHVLLKIYFFLITDGTPGRTAEVTVVINILDSNDQQPEFPKTSYNITIPENVPIGTTVLTVEAEDKDIGDNALFNYQIVGGDDKFEISSDGVIVTKAMLDYESNTSYTFLVSDWLFSGSSDTSDSLL